MRDQGRAIRLRIGRTVRKLRLLRGLSQERLAELASDSGKHVGQIERGEVNVGVDALARLANALSVDVADLFTTLRGRSSAPGIHLITRAQVETIEQIARAVQSERAPRLRRR